MYSIFIHIFKVQIYELHSLKNEIVNNKVIKVYFDGSGYTANLESDEDKKEFFNLISDFKFRFKNTMEDTEKSSPSVETELTSRLLRSPKIFSAKPIYMLPSLNALMY